MIDNKLFPCFPIPIEIYNFHEDLHELNILLLNSIYSEKANDPCGVVGSNYRGWHSKNLLDVSPFSELSAHIELCLDKYCEKNGFESGLKCGSMWANVNSENEFNMHHHHGESAMTGVYYPVKHVENEMYVFNYTDNVCLKAGSGAGSEVGGALSIEDPSYGLKTKLKRKKTQTPYTLDHYHYHPVSGTLVLMPSYLIHSVIPFQGKTERVSISFSCKYNYHGTS